MSYRAVIVGILATLIAIVAPAQAALPVDYLQEIKPILIEKCYACHSALKQESSLRVDTVALMAKGGDSGEIIVPGKANESLLIELVTAPEGERMPPEGKPLTTRQIALLKAWIDQGAKAPADEQPALDPLTFWSYQPIVRPSVPVLKNTAGVRNPIDAFILAELDNRKLVPRGEAEKEVLLRRVYLDLIGLPPTRQDLTDFLADDSADAYEKVVDRLLKSPRYGERWGRHWMDVWRYSDWYGRRASKEIRYSQYHIWRWRDWIINSLNDDKGYDRMILEMLAGDEIAAADQSVLPATGFLGRNWYKFNRSVWLQETIEHTSMGLLGVSMKCARCHDHKFDPIDQEEYYRFRAFFEPHDVRTDQVPGEADIKKDGLARVYDKQIDAPTYLFHRGDDRYPDKDNPLKPGVPKALGGATLDIKPVNLPPESYYPALQPQVTQSLVAAAQSKIDAASADLKKQQEKAAQAKAKLDQFVAKAAGKIISAGPFFRDDFSTPSSDHWKIVNGQWTRKDGSLTQSQVTNFATIVSKQNHPRNFRARLRYKTLAAGVTRSVGLSFDYQDQGNSQDIYTSANDTRTSVHAFHRQGGKQIYPPEAIVPTPIKINEIVDLELVVRGSQLKISIGGKLKIDYVMPIARREGKFALWVHSGAAEFLDLEITELDTDKNSLESAHRQALTSAALGEKKIATTQAELASLKSRIVAERAKYATPADPQAKQLALKAGRDERLVAVTKAEETLLAAEQHLAEVQRSTDKKKGENKILVSVTAKVTAARKALAAAQAAAQKENPAYKVLGSQFPKTSTGRRLALARWIANRENPRTARVAVNHIWLRHFGRGIVPSAAEFGMRTKPRSHPELLDWLAVELMEGGWQMKRLHRLIVTSTAYRRKSSAGENNPNAKIDPQNVYLWRVNSRRMEAEIVRDSMLHAAGQLDTTMGGADLDEKLGLTSRRRSVYFRTTPDNSMEFLGLFDLASPNQCYERRDSVVPQQALAMTNSVVSMNNARLLTKNISDQLKRDVSTVTDTDFIVAAFEHTLTRKPTDAELAACREFLQENATLLSDKQKLVALPPGPVAKVKPSADPIQRARENLVHVLFNHNDFVTIR